MDNDKKYNVQGSYGNSYDKNMNYFNNVNGCYYNYEEDKRNLKINKNNNNSMHYNEEESYNSNFLYNYNINNSNYNQANYNNYCNYNINYPGINNYNNNLTNYSQNYYCNDQYILNKKAAKILYIYNLSNEYTDENFIYSLCFIYGNIDSVCYIKGKNLFIVKFVLAESALNAYNNLPKYFKNLQFELRNESKKISYFNEKVNSNKYVSPNISEKKFLSLSAEKREQIMNIKQKELLRKCKEKLNEYINMFNNKNITNETKQELQTLIDHLKTRIQLLNNQCDDSNFNEFSNTLILNNYSSNNDNNNIENSTTIKISSLNNIRNNEELSNYILKNNSIFLNEHISYFSLFSFGEKYAIIKYSNENIAKNVFKNCQIYNIQVEFVPDDTTNKNDN
ncbi:conserved Plasmodium protein, unknown function [Plasmodium relictum]|uniref:RNA-binding protein n=1 Tax=Plasmodium relictum TaxID=85471 RepID=A0A1J1H9C1_PLARL|nr:conserved Plasmodium protein, unknown function [Plasmodium relictum]CRH01103.1 conserved Plasmodium protein, unknown function [Plasmodium relictum]